MAFSLEEIKGVINKNNGLFQPAHFFVRINFVGNGVSASEDLGFYATTASIPGVSFDFSEVRRQGYGPLERRARNAIFPPVTVNFMVDNAGTILDFYSKWAKTIVSFAHQVGELSVDPDHGGYLGEAGFYDDYVCNMDIIAYAPNEDKIVTYTLYDAFPQVIGDVGLGWRQRDEFAEFPVTFSYRYWTSTAFKPSERSDEPGKMGLFEFINKVKGAVEIAKSIKRPRNLQDAVNVVNNGSLLAKNIFGSG